MKLSLLRSRLNLRFVVTVIASPLSFFGLTCATVNAADGIWMNGAADNNWLTTTNWNPTGTPGSTTAGSYASTETATFSTDGSGTINLGDFINIRSILIGVSGGDAGAFTIGDVNDTLNLSNNGAITINAGVTTNQNIGVSGTSINASNTAAAATTFTNNGTGLLTIAGNLAFNVASGNGLLTVAGSGNTTVTGTITKPGAGNTALLKVGAGTLTLSNGSVWSGTGASSGGFSGPLIMREGLLLLNGGTHAVTGEAVIGGVVTNGGAGQNAKIQVDAGALNISGFLSVGRGNGVGGVSSDLVLNNGATVSAGNFSSGYNGNNALNLPKGSITLNNTATLTIGNAGQFTHAESVGSNFTMTLNNSSGVTITGAGSATNRIIGGAGATGLVTLNDTSSFNAGSSILNVGYQTGNGTLTVNGGTFTLTSELRVGATNANGVFAGGSGVVNVAGGTMTINALTIARSNDATGKLNGTVNVSAGTLTASTGGVIVGYNGDGTVGGNLNITGGTFNANGTSGTNSMFIGTTNSGRGIVTVNGGILNSANDMVLAENASSSGSVTLTTGTINVGTSTERWIKLNTGSSGNTTFTVNGGTLNLNNNSDLRFTTAAAATGTNTFTLSGGLVQGQTGNQNGVPSLTSVVDLNQAATGTPNNTFNLNGGTLHIGQVITTNNSGTALFSFNGGTLKAAGNTANFLDLGGAAQTAVIAAGGAFIDSNSFAVTIPQPLLAGSPSGGLTKTGAGTLTLTGANDYTGSTTVNAGTLTVGTGGTIGATTGSLAVNNPNTGAGTSVVLNLATAVDTTKGSLSGTIAAPLSGTNTVTINNGGTGRNFTVNQTSAGNFAGVIAGAGSFTLGSLSTSTLTLSGTNSYLGNTTVSGGQLVVTGTIASNGPAAVFITAPDSNFSSGPANPVLTRRVANGASYTLGSSTGLGSTAISTDPEVLNDVINGMNTTAAILNGTATGQTDVSMQWRARTASEAAGSNPNAVLSNVLNLSGIYDGGTPSDGILDQFVLQMSYTDSSLSALGLNETAIATSGELRLGWLDGGTWKSAFLGNNNGTGTGTFIGVVPYNSSDLAHNVLGAYGVDPNTNTVWAVLNHNSEFAVIPEPSTFVVGGLALLGLAGMSLRRRRQRGQ